MPVHQINKHNIFFQLMSVHCAGTSAVLKEQVQYFLVLCRPENGIFDQFAALGSHKQPWGDSDDALGQPPKCGAAAPPSAERLCLLFQMLG